MLESSSKKQYSSITIYDLNTLIIGFFSIRAWEVDVDHTLNFLHIGFSAILKFVSALALKNMAYASQTSIKKAPRRRLYV